MLKDVNGLERFQLVQRRLDRLDLAIVRGAAFDDASLAYIRREVAKVLGESVELDCHFVDDIPLTRSGKLRVTVCELSCVNITHFVENLNRGGLERMVLELVKSSVGRGIAARSYACIEPVRRQMSSIPWVCR